MAAECSSETAQACPASESVAVAPKAGMRLYQAATLLVILLFLLSFWSC